MSKPALPQSLDAEQAVLGAILLYPEALGNAVDAGLNSNDFFQSSHRHIFEAAQALDQAGQNVDMTLLINRLNEVKLINQVGGVNYLSDLLATATTLSNITAYVEIIRSKAQLRQLISSAQIILAESTTSSENLNEVFDKAEKMILDITHNRLTKDFKSAQEITSNVIELVNQMSENKSGITGMKTGYHALDNVTSGFQKGDLIILAARPAMGKTALALNLALKMAHLNQLPVAIFSLEMPGEQLISRMLSSRSRIN